MNSMSLYASSFCLQEFGCVGPAYFSRLIHGSHAIAPYVLFKTPHLLSKALAW